MDVLREAVTAALGRCRSARQVVGEQEAARKLEMAAKRLERLALELSEWEPTFGSPLEMIEAQLEKVMSVVGPLLEEAESVEGARVLFAPPRPGAQPNVTAVWLGDGWRVRDGESGEVLVVRDHGELLSRYESRPALATDDLELWRAAIVAEQDSMDVALVLGAA